MSACFSTQLAKRISGASDNQLKYWVRIGLIKPEKQGKLFYYTFRDLITLRLIISLKKGGLSLQKIRRGIDNLVNVLPEQDQSLSRLIIYTDGIDIIVSEKGAYFSATSMQRYFRFDTEQLENEIVQLNNEKIAFHPTAVAVYR